jgi:hypothetical protein
MPKLAAQKIISARDSLELPISPTFDYVRFMRSLDLSELYTAVGDWFNFYESRGWLLEAQGSLPVDYHEIGSTPMRTYRQILRFLGDEYGADGFLITEDFVFTILSNFFTKNCDLHQLSVDTFGLRRMRTCTHECLTLRNTLTDGCFGWDLTLPSNDSQSCLKNITEFICTTRAAKRDLFQKLLELSVQGLERLSINLGYPCEPAYRSTEADVDGLIGLLETQSALKSLEIWRCRVQFDRVLEAIKFQTHTLRVIYFTEVWFSGTELFPLFAECARLEELKLERCRGFSLIDETYEGINTWPRTLKKLELVESDISNRIAAEMVLQSSKTLRRARLVHLVYESEPIVTAFKIVVEHCRNIKDLAISLWPVDYPYLKTLFERHRELESFTVLQSPLVDAYQADALFKYWGKTKLGSLTHLGIHTKWEFSPSSLRTFLKESHAPLRTIELDGMENFSDEHLRVLVDCLGRRLQSFIWTLDKDVKERWIRRPFRRSRGTWRVD